ncbi:MAG: glycosyltransferase family 2 protein [Bacteroidia bacterium]|jgi:glycosyltransferase involved in cell wall biosynthesis
MAMIKVSIILPVLNEIKSIAQVLNNLLSDESVSREIIVADGGSVDGTDAWVASFALQHPEVRLIRNPDKYVSNALNRCIPEARGQYIAILGAHADYPKTYIHTAVTFLDDHANYVMVGGPINHVAKTPTGKSIAFCMTSSFGMGNSAFRTSIKDMDSDTVPFPVYRKELFFALGGYDPALIRTQDSDFHYRAIRAGYKIRMQESLRSDYHTREDLKSFSLQFYSYGFYKAHALVKPGYIMKWRHFVPACFTLYIIGLLLTTFFADASFRFRFPAFIYVLIAFYYSSRNWKNLSMFITNMIAFPLMHLSYGTGTVAGFLTIMLKKIKN